MALDAYFADVDAEIAADDVGQIQQNARAVDAAQLDGRKVGDGLVLRPLDLVLDDVAPELRCEPVQLLAGGLVDDDLARLRIAESHDLVARNGFAALGDDEFRRRVVRRLVDRRRFVVLALRLRLFGDEQRPEFQDLARRVDFQMLLYIVQPDDACTDFAVKLLLGRTFVCRNQLAQYTSRKVDIEFGEPLGERPYPVRCCSAVRV